MLACVMPDRISEQVMAWGSVATARHVNNATVVHTITHCTNTVTVQECFPLNDGGHCLSLPSQRVSRKHIQLSTPFGASCLSADIMIDNHALRYYRPASQVSTCTGTCITGCIYTRIGAAAISV